MSPIEFNKLIHQYVQLIVDSNNELDTLESSKNDYEKNKQNIDKLHPDNIIICEQFEHILNLGFKRVEERKVELLDTSCPFNTHPF
jgi:hypothetical protein